jgi:hypothetical protein
MKNSKNRGWVRLHRSIDENFLWFSEPFTKAQAWVDLFMNANHKDSKICIRGNFIDIKRGQIGWSEITMTKRWRWSKNKVRRFLKLLETEQQIEQQKFAKLTTIITINNYESYQSDTTDDTTEGLQKDYRRYTNKNDKKVKNDKNDNKSERGSQVNKVFDVFHNSINPTINYGNTTSRKATEWMIDKWGIDAVISMSEYACSIHGKPYAPTVTTPYQLKEKISNIKAYKEKQTDNSNGITII